MTIVCSANCIKVMLGSDVKSTDTGRQAKIFASQTENLHLQHSVEERNPVFIPQQLTFGTCTQIIMTGIINTSNRMMKKIYCWNNSDVSLKNHTGIIVGTNYLSNITRIAVT